MKSRTPKKGKKSVHLTVSTDPRWVQVILKNFDVFLADHADCERKASAMAMALVSKCPDRTEMIPSLVDLALEELLHFKQVYALMEKRGVQLSPVAINDPYVNALLKLCRSPKEERLLDKLLMLSIVEARGAERFRIVAQALKDPELKAFYRRLYMAEARHGSLFVNLAMNYFDERVIGTRLSGLLKAEGEIIQRLEWRPSLH